MKKMFLVMAVLLLASSAMAEVKITCSQNEDVITVAYDATSEVNLPRAFALDITLVDTVSTDNAVVSAVTPTVTGESAVGNRGFGIFLGADGIDINATTGIVNGYGSPVANPADPCAATGIGTNAITIELGSLYGGVQGVSNPNAPAKSGNLLTFTVNKKVADVVITLNQRRAGIVMEDPDEAVDANLPGTGGVAAFPIVCPGDIVGPFFGAKDHIVNSWDYNLITNVAQWLQTVPPADARADICGPFFSFPPDGTVNSWDLNYVTNAGRWLIDWR
jgi:hypothetical protein